MRRNGGGHILIVAVAVGAAAAQVAAHPHSGPVAVAHEHTPLGLEVTIADDGVTCQVLMSNGYFNLQIPRERGRLKLARRGEVFAFLDPAEEAGERDAFAAFFADAAPAVTIDGAAASAEFAGFEFLPSIDPTGVLDHTLAPPDARVTLHFPSSGPPQRVRLEWTLFPVGMARDAFGQVRSPELPVKLDAYAETRIVTLTPESAVLAWSRPSPAEAPPIAPIQLQKRGYVDAIIPLVSVGLVGAWLVTLLALHLARARRTLRRGTWVAGIAVLAGAYGLRNVAPWPIGLRIVAEPAPLTPEKAEAAFTALLGNVYHAFDYKSESDIYDVLARSVDGEQLDVIYNEIYQSLVAREQGGAVARVKDLDFVTVNVEDEAADQNGAPERFNVRCRWRVHGVVHHWGHVHERTNEYKALYTVARRGDLWKITGCELLGQRRLGNEPAPPGAAAGENAPS